MKRNYLLVVFMLCAAAAISPTAWPPCHGQTTSSWLAIGTSTAWFDSNNWTGGVPFLAGDVAQIPAAAKFAPTIGSNDSVSLGQLDFSGSGVIAINGSGSLMFLNPGVAPAVISAPRTQSRSVAIAPTLLVSDGELLSLEPGARNSFTFTSGLGSGAGAVALNGAGQATLNSGSPSWLGQMTVNTGQLVVNSVSALGSTATGTVINGGVVTLSAVVAEPFTLQGGTLDTSVHFLDLTGPLYLPAGNNAVVRGPFDILGGASGPGDLLIVATETALSEN